VVGVVLYPIRQQGAEFVNIVHLSVSGSVSGETSYGGTGYHLQPDHITGGFLLPNTVAWHMGASFVSRFDFTAKSEALLLIPT
jgi:hypothetical protein